jgi:hypothetical protein
VIKGRCGYVNWIFFYCKTFFKVHLRFKVYYIFIDINSPLIGKKERMY